MEKKSFVPFKSYCLITIYCLKYVSLGGLPTTGATKSLRNFTFLCLLQECRCKASEIKKI